MDVAKPWLETSINLAKVKGKANSFIAIFSDNDPYVSLEENRKIFEGRLGAKIIIEPGKGHFSEDSGVKELPVLLELVQN